MTMSSSRIRTAFAAVIGGIFAMGSFYRVDGFVPPAAVSRPHLGLPGPTRQSFSIPSLPVPSGVTLTTSTTTATTSLGMAYGRYGDGRSSSRYADSSSNGRSKRQERVGHVVRTELARIIQAGYPIKHADSLDDDLRRRINVVNADVSPDLRHARVTVSVIARRGGRSEERGEDFPSSSVSLSSSSSAVVDRRRAYSWLVRSTKMIRHAMAQRISHMKVCPDITFVQADVGAAVDVMHLIDKVSGGGYKRESVGMFGGYDDSVPLGAEDWEKMTDFDDNDDDDDDDDDDGWVDLDEDDDWENDDEEDFEEMDVSKKNIP